MTDTPNDAQLPEDDEENQPRSVSTHAVIWARVEELWQMVMKRDMAGVDAALHPRYTGWEHGTMRPHERGYAIRSVGPEAPAITSYQLQPWRVRIFGEHDTVAVVHYNYRAQVVDTDDGGDQSSRIVTGCWTEMYLKENGVWLLTAVHGGPDPE